MLYQASVVVCTDILVSGSLTFGRVKCGNWRCKLQGTELGTDCRDATDASKHPGTLTHPELINLNQATTPLKVLHFCSSALIRYRAALFRFLHRLR